MYDAGVASQSTASARELQRVNGHARAGFRLSEGSTRLADLYQSGAAKIRLPKVYDEPTTAVLINTAGGLTGGDRLSLEFHLAVGAHAIVTSQAAERAYRSQTGPAKVTAKFQVGAGAKLEWLPQETILFDASNLSRTIEADLAEDAGLLMLESVILGRKAMGEKVRSVFFRDSWRIRRSGKLVFADDVRLEGDPDVFLAGPATASGNLCVATLLDCSPQAEDHLNLARSLIGALPSDRVRAAASTWNGQLVARLTAVSGQDLRTALVSFLTGYRSAPLPRVWHC
ncbi:Urease accessory protein UreD [Labrenzia sp. THAF82]|uniref:urease accessory protein UreD n=1 Tax=Labrenzia sp. THAF82 TaxID=2587861 RepID=UPI001267A976|nr:urease accessory protein UreD [Labrenzia sp. THAF82]QFT29244.1 Urease accessory protein UreD [Labrenzia sp. THAF82]